ncbi:EAL domain-containing protein [Shewanella sp. NFH-SH190041]|uniref:EAL domain-containing protein n=1 Tax=Shewanella sp. NFH-SH190041 TaxID=2950245 RepID=UPI0021C3271A|nr:EAL domain-containing protein [Shewanella sp. NFH-SH190041]
MVVFILVSRAYDIIFLSQTIIMRAYVQLSGNRFFLAARESFVALLPFILISSSVALLQVLLQQCFPALQGSTFAQELDSFSLTLSMLFPLLAMVSLSIHFGKYLSLSGLTVVTLSLMVLLAIHAHIHPDSSFADYAREVINDPKAILLPVAAAYILHWLQAAKWLKLPGNHGLNAYLAEHLDLLLPTVVGFILLMAVTILCAWVADAGEALFRLFLSHLGAAGQLLCMGLLRGLLWSVGIHGDSVYMLFPKVIEQMPQVATGLNNRNLVDLFAGIGGSGATLSLLLAIFWRGRGHGLRVARVSLPFSIFNINEPLLYGLPVAFNPRLLLPFLLLPCLNMLLVYAALSFGWLQFNGQAFPWVTPPLLNAWISSQSIGVVAFQAGLILLGVLVYAPFIRYANWQDDWGQGADYLATRLGLKADMARQSEAGYFAAQSVSLQQADDSSKIIERVLAGELQVHYQPKLALDNGHVVGFEALLRLKEPDGRMSGPFFIDTFQQAGYAFILDRFVIETVAGALQQWQKQQFYPTVSINLDPHSLLGEQVLPWLESQLGAMAKQVEIEILETAFIGDVAKVNANIDRLRALGFRFLLDDFGTGYSSLGLLTKIHLDGVKLDRSILTRISEDKGGLLYRQICSLCLSQGLALVAEGVETETEEQFVRGAGVDVVQGWRYAKAMPAEDARTYMLNRNG